MLMSNHIKIASKLGYRWAWQLITTDGHVAHESEYFQIRGECEADALAQGLPVKGLTRTAKRSPAGRVANGTALCEIRHDGIGWIWERFSPSGDRRALAARRFLTRREALDDAEARADETPISHDALGRRESRE